MKRSLLIGFRGLLFALGAFMLLALGGIQVRSSRDVAIFVLGLTAFWILIERIVLTIKRRPPKTPGAP